MTGASQLCHAYATNQLTPTVDDIEIVLEPNVKTIRERPLFPPGVQGSKYRAHGTGAHSDAFHALTSAPHSEEDGGEDDEEEEEDAEGNRQQRTPSYNRGTNRKRGASSNMQGSMKLARMGDYGNGNFMGIHLN